MTAEESDALLIQAETPEFGAFLRSVYAEPEEDTRRLAFADYLDENGRPHAAEWLRDVVRRRLRPVDFKVRKTWWCWWAGREGTSVWVHWEVPPRLFLCLSPHMEKVWQGGRTSSGYLSPRAKRIDRKRYQTRDGALRDLVRACLLAPPVHPDPPDTPGAAA